MLGMTPHNLFMAEAKLFMGQAIATCGYNFKKLPSMAKLYKAAIVNSTLFVPYSAKFLFFFKLRIFWYLKK